MKLVNVNLCVSFHLTLSKSHFSQGTEENNVKFPGPVLIDGEPSDTYYRLEYLGQSPDCDAGNCRGPHYCSVEAAEAGGIWGDWCPYIHTGENSGQESLFYCFII